MLVCWYVGFDHDDGVVEEVFRGRSAWWEDERCGGKEVDMESGSLSADSHVGGGWYGINRVG